VRPPACQPLAGCGGTKTVTKTVTVVRTVPSGGATSVGARVAAGAHDFTQVRLRPEQDDVANQQRQRRQRPGHNCEEREDDEREDDIRRRCEMSAISDEPSIDAREKRRWSLQLLVPEMWACLAIVVIWLAVLSTPSSVRTS
jgi:hypothetical protein